MFKKYLEKSILNKKNVVHVLNNIALAQIPSIFGINKNFLNIKQENNKMYIFTTADTYTKNIDYYYRKMNFDFFKQNNYIDMIKYNIDINTFDFFSSILKSDNKKMLTAYLNFMVNYWLFLIIYHKSERKLNNLLEENNISLNDLKTIYPSYYNFYNQMLFAKNTEILTQKNKKIIKYRKKKLKKNMDLYYFYDYIDFFSYYLDSYYVLAELLYKNYKYNPMEILELAKKYSYKNYIIPNVEISVLYNNLLYFTDYSDKIDYFVKVCKYYGYNYFSDKILIEKYPKISFTIKKIQKELNIRL